MLFIFKLRLQLFIWTGALLWYFIVWSRFSNNFFCFKYIYYLLPSVIISAIISRFFLDIFGTFIFLMISYIYSLVMSCWNKISFIFLCIFLCRYWIHSFQHHINMLSPRQHDLFSTCTYSSCLINSSSYFLSPTYFSNSFISIFSQTCYFLLTTNLMDPAHLRVLIFCSGMS